MYCRARTCWSLSHGLTLTQARNYFNPQQARDCGRALIRIDRAARCRRVVVPLLFCVSSTSMADTDTRDEVS